MVTFDSSVLNNRLSLLNEYLQNLKEMQELTEKEFLGDFRNYSAVERLLQLAIEACCDIGNHLIAMNTWGKPGTYREIFQVLTEKGILDEELGKKFENMAGFRNIIVHHYFKIDRKIVYGIVQDNLDDFKAFAEKIVGLMDDQE